MTPDTLSLFDGGPAVPCPHPFHLTSYVLGRAARTPAKTALEIIGRSPPERWTYGALDRAVRGTARGLRQRGLAPGDRILMRLGNTVEFPILFLAAIAADLIPVPSSAALTAPEVARIIADLDPALIVRGPDIPCPPTLVPILPAAALAALHDLPPLDPVPGDPDRPAYIVYTSGTSGVPRAVVHAHRAVWARRMMWDGWYGLSPRDRVFHAGALNWTYTLGTGLFDPWAIGGTALIPAAGIDRRALPDLLRSARASLFAAVPGVFRQLLDSAADLTLPDLRHALSAGEALPPRIARAWRDRTGTPIHEALGMSECSTFISGRPGLALPPGAMGVAQPGRLVAVLDPGGNGPVARGRPGILAVHRSDPGLMLGYRGAPDDTAARFRDGWFLTGDMVSMDGSGAITYQGRADAMLTAGGHRVAPIEVEQVIETFPGIREAAVAAQRVKADTLVIAAWYAASGAVDEAALARHCAARLARYKCPRVFHRLPVLPRSPNGKLLRARLPASKSSP